MKPFGGKHELVGIRTKLVILPRECYMAYTMSTKRFNIARYYPGEKRDFIKTFGDPVAAPLTLTERIRLTQRER